MVRQVAIEGIDDPVAIAPGLAEIAFRRQLDQVARVGVADDVEPVPAPPLAVPRRGQQAVDDSCERLGRLIGEEGIDLRGRRRQADQVERGPSEQRASVGRRGGCQPLFLESRQQKAVDRRTGPRTSRGRPGRSRP